MKKIIITEAQMEQIVHYEMIEQISENVIEIIENLNGTLYAIVDDEVILKAEDNNGNYVHMKGVTDNIPTTKGEYHPSTYYEPEEYPEEIWEPSKFVITDIEDLHIPQYEDFIEENFETIIKYLTGKELNVESFNINLDNYEWRDDEAPEYGRE